MLLSLLEESLIVPGEFIHSVEFSIGNDVEWGWDKEWGSKDIEILG